MEEGKFLDDKTERYLRAELIKATAEFAAEVASILEDLRSGSGKMKRRPTAQFDEAIPDKNSSSS